jgi:Zn-dependent metalloprotease
VKILFYDLFSQQTCLYLRQIFYMQKVILSLFLLLFVNMAFSRDKILQDQEANYVIAGASLIRYTEHSSLPNYIRFRTTEQIPISDFNSWIGKQFKLNSNYGFIELNTINDELGLKHIRLQQTFNQIPVKGSMLILHTKNNKVESMSGVFFENIQYPVSSSILSEANCLQLALNKINAQTYKWQILSEEFLLKEEMNDNEATYYPKAQLFILKTDIEFHYCYAFNIYAQEPVGRTMELLYRANYFIKKFD